MTTSSSPSAGVPVAEVESLPVLNVASTWDEVLAGPARAALEEQILPEM